MNALVSWWLSLVININRSVQTLFYSLSLHMWILSRKKIFPDNFCYLTLSDEPYNIHTFTHYIHESTLKVKQYWQDQTWSEWFWFKYFLRKTYSWRQHTTLNMSLHHTVANCTGGDGVGPALLSDDCYRLFDAAPQQNDLKNSQKGALEIEIKSFSYKSD